jgi:hypothetical protein
MYITHRSDLLKCGIDAGKEVGLEVNTERLKYTMLLSRHQNAGENHDIEIGNMCGTVEIFLNDDNRSKFDSG